MIVRLCRAEYESKTEPPGGEPGGGSSHFVQAAQIMAAAASTAKMRANRYAPTLSATPKQKIASKASRLSRRTVGFMARQVQNSPGPRVIDRGSVANATVSPKGPDPKASIKPPGCEPGDAACLLFDATIRLRPCGVATSRADRRSPRSGVSYPGPDWLDPRRGSLIGSRSAAGLISFSIETSSSRTPQQ
jgi:hypothetical protein